MAKVGFRHDADQMMKINAEMDEEVQRIMYAGAFNTPVEELKQELSEMTHLFHEDHDPKEEFVVSRSMEVLEEAKAAGALSLLKCFLASIQVLLLQHNQR